MRPGDRDDGRRGGSNTGFFGGGFGGFPDFADPFEGFSMFGRGGGGRNMIQEFFGHDPFDDPFFRRPFGGLFGTPGSLFNSGGLFGGNRGMGMGILDDGPFQHPSANFHIDQRPFNPPQQGVRRGPVIEELPDDDEAPVSESRPHHTEPIIEHPDDEAIPGDENHESTSVTAQYKPSQSHPNYTSQSFCYQSSSVSGPGGAFYTSSSARRVGPNGVMEEGHYEKDSSAGTESRKVARALGDKMHAVSKKRNADGRENTLETLHNLTEEEAGKFNQTWERRAGSSLLGSPNISRMLEGNRGGSSRQSQICLPSNEGYSDEIQQAKKHLRR